MSTTPINELFIGTPNRECASCRREFNATHPRAGDVRVLPYLPGVPVGHFQFAYGICGCCLRQAKADEAGRTAVMAAVGRFHNGTPTND